MCKINASRMYTKMFVKSMEILPVAKSSSPTILRDAIREVIEFFFGADAAFDSTVLVSAYVILVLSSFRVARYEIVGGLLIHEGGLIAGDVGPHITVCHDSIAIHRNRLASYAHHPGQAFVRHSVVLLPLKWDNNKNRSAVVKSWRGGHGPSWQ